MNKEILESNKLIAKYMGAEIKEETFCFHLGNPAFQIQIEQMTFEPVFRLHYHDSWNWLMPVVIQIAVETKHPIYLYFSHIQNSAYLHELNKPADVLSGIIRKSESRRTFTPIQVIYSMVVEFIRTKIKS
jgi:hypothetical protein